MAPPDPSWILGVLVLREEKGRNEERKGREGRKRRGVRKGDGDGGMFNCYAIVEMRCWLRHCRRE